MAIRKKEDVSKNSLPTKLDKLLLQGFSFQQISAKYKDAFDATKDEVEAYLESNDDSFDVDMGKGFKCDQGTVIYTERSSYDYNKDEIIEMVKDGKVTLETLIGLATFSAEKLKVALGESNFNKVSTLKKTNSLTFKANADFKEECERKFVDILPRKEEEETPAPKKEEPKKEVKKKEAKVDVEKAKSAAALARSLSSEAPKKKKATTVDEDLEAILGE